MNVQNGFAGTVGRTPLIRLRRLSEETGCEIFGNAEFMNPGGSVKDRAALAIIEDAERRGELTPGGIVVEGTAGNTGIGLAHVCDARGYRCIIVMPDKSNQFDNTANRRTHVETTGPEVWEQTDGRIDAFVAAGTGGTIAGVSEYLKSRRQSVRCVVADPPGSSLYEFVPNGVLKATGSSSITEGIGIGRVTDNFADAPLDDAVHVEDADTVRHVYRLLNEEGLFLGGTSGINVAAAARVARELGPGHTVVTVLCDGGAKYQSRLFNPEWLAQKGLAASAVRSRRVQRIQMENVLVA